MAYYVAMATYVIGDVQGCFITLERLLQRVHFDPLNDVVWLVGDLVNRGPDSLKVLRWAREMGDRVVTVLGNHDIHLIDRVCGIRAEHVDDTFQDVLEAPDRDSLITWLTHRPLLYTEKGYLMIHAGLLPDWSIDDAVNLAKKAEVGLRGQCLNGYLKNVLDALTRLRTCTKTGDMCLNFTGPPQKAPAGFHPWFDLVTIPEGTTVLFGHWASLGLYMGKRVIGLDTGCVWGGVLTAFRLEDHSIFQEPSELRR